MKEFVFGKKVFKMSHGKYPVPLITVEEGECFLCGRKTKLTEHHVLNKGYKPKNNITIPLCEICHKFVHNMNSTDEEQILRFNSVQSTIQSSIQKEVNNRLKEDSKYLSQQKVINKMQNKLNKLHRINNELQSKVSKPSEPKPPKEMGKRKPRMNFGMRGLI